MGFCKHVPCSVVGNCVVNFKRSVVVSALFILSFRHTKLMCYYQEFALNFSIQTLNRVLSV